MQVVGKVQNGVVQVWAVGEDGRMIGYRKKAVHKQEKTIVEKRKEVRKLPSLDVPEFMKKRRK